MSSGEWRSRWALRARFERFFRRIAGSLRTARSSREVLPADGEKQWTARPSPYTQRFESKSSSGIGENAAERCSSDEYAWRMAKTGLSNSSSLPSATLCKQNPSRCCSHTITIWRKQQTPSECKSTWHLSPYFSTLPPSLSHSSSSPSSTVTLTAQTSFCDRTFISHCCLHLYNLYLSQHFNFASSTVHLVLSLLKLSPNIHFYLTCSLHHSTILSKYAKPPHSLSSHHLSYFQLHPCSSYNLFYSDLQLIIPQMTHTKNLTSSAKKSKTAIKKVKPQQNHDHLLNTLQLSIKFSKFKKTEMGLEFPKSEDQSLTSFQKIKYSKLSKKKKVTYNVYDGAAIEFEDWYNLHLEQIPASVLDKVCWAIQICFSDNVITKVYLPSIPQDADAPVKSSRDWKSIIDLTVSKISQLLVNLALSAVSW